MATSLLLDPQLRGEEVEKEDPGAKYRKRRQQDVSMGRGWVKLAIFVPVAIFILMALNYAGMHTSTHRPHLQRVVHLKPTPNITSHVSSSLPPLPEEAQHKPGDTRDDDGGQRQAGGDQAQTENQDGDTGRQDPAKTLACARYLRGKECRIPVEYFESALPQELLAPMPTKRLEAGPDQAIVDIANFKFTCQTMHEASHDTHLLIMHTFERMCLRFAALCSEAHVQAHLHRDSSSDPEGKGKGRRDVSAAAAVAEDEVHGRGRRDLEGESIAFGGSVAAPVAGAPTGQTQQQQKQNKNRQNKNRQNKNKQGKNKQGKNKQGKNKKKSKGDVAVKSAVLSTKTFVLQELLVDVRKPEKELDIGVDETYLLVVPAASDTPVTLMSNTVWGMLHGMETFFQLIGRGKADSKPTITGVPIVIEDGPQQEWRGMLLDTSRHFYPTPVILRLIEGMAMSHMNVLHWHMTDDQSFPVVIDKYPQLSKKGAYPAAKRHSYTKDMIRFVTEYAHNRSILVVPEIDIPGHAASWGLGVPKLHSCEGGHGPINPTSNESFEVIDAIIQELAPLFPHRYFHVGGDEFNLDCWQSNPDIAAAMRKDNDPRGEKLRQNLMNAAFDSLKLVGKTPIIWKDLVETHPITIPDNTLIQHWKCWGNEVCTLADTLRKDKHDALQSTCAYLDFDSDWHRFYQRNMLFVDKCGARSSTRRLHGGEAAVWSERIDPTNVYCRAFPRAIAHAERLWSYNPDIIPNNNATKAFFPRMKAKMLAMRVMGLPLDVDMQYDDVGYCPLLPEKKSTKNLDRFSKKGNKTKKNSKDRGQS